MTTEPIGEFMPVTINGSDTSAAIDLQGNRLCGIFFPASMSGATMKILASYSEEGDYTEVTEGHTSALDLSITVTSSKYVPITNLAIPAGLRFIKLKSAISETNKTLFLAVRPV